MKTVAVVSALALCFSLAACSGGDGGSAAPPTAGAPPAGGAPPGGTPPANAAATMIDTPQKASAFLARAGFGGTMRDMDGIMGDDMADWIKSEIGTSRTRYLSQILPIAGDNETVLGVEPHNGVFWRAAIAGDDVLRQRMVFALSQIFVVSDGGRGNQEVPIGYYLDLLSENAFGNYRDLLQDITYSPAMATYLTYLRNRKGDERSGRMPDENYARELMQLFTIGLVELNQDGTVRTGPDGQPIETYTNEDVVGLARVFTGLSLKGSGFSDADDDGLYNPLQVFPSQHSELEKSFLGLTIPAGTSAEVSIDMALDHLFQHDNVPPFFARQLIQRFTASNPDPAYVRRVADAFASGRFTAPNGEFFGSSQRGDMEATIAAVLLDPTVGIEEQTSGKIREPVLKFVYWARAFNVSELNLYNETSLRRTGDATRSLGQQPFSSPSVFNFYRPGFIAPGTLSGNAGLTAPELQILNEGATVGFLNFMTNFILDRTSVRDRDEVSFLPNYDDEIALARDPAALADHLNILLSGGNMSVETRDSIIAALTPMPINETEPDRDLRDRVAVAIIIVVMSPAFSVTF